MITFVSIMNPNNKSNEDRGYFTYSISRNISTPFIIMLCLIGIGSVIAFLMIDKERKLEVKKQRNDSLSKIAEDNEEEKTIFIYKQIVTFCSFYPIVKEEVISINKSEKRLSIEYNQAIYSMRLYRLVIINFTSSFVENLIFITFIPYAAMNRMSYFSLYYSSLAMLILSAIIHPIFEYIKDKVSFQQAMLTKSVLSLIIGCSFPLSKNYSPTYLLICFLTVITNTVREGSLIKHLESAFNDVFVYRYIINTGVVSFIISAICISYIPPLFEDNNSGYLAMFIIGGLMNIVSFLLVLWEGRIKQNSVVVDVSDDNVFY